MRRVPVLLHRVPRAVHLHRGGRVPAGRQAPRLRALPGEVRDRRAALHLLRLLRRGVPVRRDSHGHRDARGAVRLARPVHLREGHALEFRGARRVARDGEPAARAGRSRASGRRSRCTRTDSAHRRPIPSRSRRRARAAYGRTPPRPPGARSVSTDAGPSQSSVLLQVSQEPRRSGMQFVEAPWRNGRRRRFQNLPLERASGFEPRRGHRRGTFLAPAPSNGG